MRKIGILTGGGDCPGLNAVIRGVVEECAAAGIEVYGFSAGWRGALTGEGRWLTLKDVEGLQTKGGTILESSRTNVMKEENGPERVRKTLESLGLEGMVAKDTADKISKLAQAQNYDLRVIGIPKTIDNDLPITDHTPGYGSVIKYISTTVREISCDNAAMGQHDLVQIVEVMGRSAGWIAAGASLAKRRDCPNDPPHIICLPEVVFSPEKFIADVKKVLAREKFCSVVVGEGLVDADGNYVSASNKTDAFGHAQLGGAGSYLQGLIEQQMPGIKARLVTLGMAQRAAAHCSSKADNEESFQAGVKAVRAAVEEAETDKMVTIVRGNTDHYSVEYGLAPLSDIANGVKKLPREWINEDGISMNYQFVRYAQPLIAGEVAVQFDNGLPVFAHLDKVRVEKLLPAHEL